MAAGTGGIQFNGDTAAWNALDDYEEGVFTPTIVGQSTAGVGTYSIQAGAYTKIGNRVVFQLRLVWSAHTGTGFMRISALPFTATGSTAIAAVSLRHNNITLPASTTAQAYVVTSSDTIAFESVPVAGGAAASLTMDTAGDVIIAGQYITA
jgi:hypothetical protein